VEWPQGSDYGGPRPAAKVAGYLGTRVRTDFSPMSRRSYESGSGKSDTGLLRRNPPLTGLLLLSRPELQRAPDRIVDGVRSNWGFNVSPHGAEPIANLIVGGHAAANRWRVPEHSTNKWLVDRTAGSPVLRPYGTTSAHSLERSHLLLQSWELGGRKLDWAQSSKALFTDGPFFGKADIYRALQACLISDSATNW
jgi:N-acylglucosamine 2-epimerase